MKFLLCNGLVVFMLITASCTRSFDQIDYGKDNCTYCKMTIVDKSYAAEMIDSKGKTFKFDDIACMKHYLSENHISQAGAEFYIAGYLQKHDNFLNARQAVYLQNSFFRSPMGGNTGAFENEAEANDLRDSLHTVILSWNELKY